MEAIDEIKKNDPVTNDKDVSLCLDLLDFNTIAATEHDWHSTKTFQIFLDALDFNQPAIAHEKKDNIIRSSNDISKTSSCDTKEVEAKPQDQPKSPVKKQQAIETILSAEALKILSELPDLSHMTTTRSFIFPNQDR